MRTVGNTDEVCDAYVNGGTIKRNGGGSVYWDYDVIYSYGRHFPMARKLPGGEILVNSDRYSSTTDRHQRYLHAALRKPNVPTRLAWVSFSVLRLHGVDIMRDDIEVRDVHDETHSYRDANAHDVISWTEDLLRTYGDLGAFSEHSYRHNTPPLPSQISFHLTGSALLKVGAAVFWASMDEGQYFVCELSDRQVYRISDAIMSLKPKEIRHIDGVIRQGEYFFAPVTGRHSGSETLSSILKRMTPQKWVRMTDGHRQGWPINKGRVSWGRHIVNERDPQQAHHTARYAVFYDGKWYVKGEVRDRQHATAKLEKDVWYSVHHNTQFRSFSAEGRID